jgi:hypothetical protein
MIMENRPSASDQIELLQLSHRHGLDPLVLRFARFGEPTRKRAAIAARFLYMVELESSAFLESRTDSLS